MNARVALLSLVLTATFATAQTLVVALGDSLTEGLGVAPDEAWPAILQAAWKKSGRDVTVVNAGISGATSASGPARAAWTLKRKPRWVLVCLGANDGMRGVPASEMKANLLRTLKTLREGGARPVLLGMRLPPNYGAETARAFEAVFPEVARETGVPFLPFLLEGVAADPSLNQADRIHPNAEGHRRIARHVQTFLEKTIF